MKVLFVSSGKSGGVGELVRNQGDSLIKKGINIQYFIFQSGIRGYAAGIFDLRRVIKCEEFDLIHAHYSLSGFAATLAGGRPIIVSLMGSDVYKSFYHRLLIKFFHFNFWDRTIVKTKRMANKLNITDAEIIPNGVDIDRFKPVSKQIARKKIGYPLCKKLIIFVSNPIRQEKNYALALETMKLLTEYETELLPVYNVPNNEIPVYMNAADVLLLTSIREGSVNVVKEAMACNLPIVSTDVGDVRENTSGVKGCFVCDADPAKLAEGLIKALSLNTSYDGRKRILELRLDSQDVAERIKQIYNDVLKP